MTAWLALVGCTGVGLGGETEPSKDSDTTDTGESTETGDTDESDSGAESTDTDTGVEDTGEPYVDPERVDLGTFGATKWVAESEGALAGYAVSFAGDVDGDGLDDMIVGAPVEFGRGTPGGVYLRHGPGGGSGSLGASEVFYGPTADFQSGSVVRGAGDVDGNGFDDLVIGVQTGGTYGDGAAYIVFAPYSADGVPLRVATLEGEYFKGSLDAPQGEAGSWVEGGGDVNGDGYSDVAIGADQAATVFVVFGPAVLDEIDLAYADIRFHDAATNPPHASFVGDTNADGLDDLLIGWPELGVAGLLYLGGTTGEILRADADATLTYGFGDYSGWAAGPLDDANGDGYGDLWTLEQVQAADATDTSALQMLNGPLAASSDVSDSFATFWYDHSGYKDMITSASAADFDADGALDIAIAVPDAIYEYRGANGAGTVFVEFGPFAGTMATSEMRHHLGGDGVDRVGWSLSARGDADGDGRADLLLGAVGDDEMGEDAGAAWLVPGALLTR